MNFQGIGSEILKKKRYRWGFLGILSDNALFLFEMHSHTPPAFGHLP